MSWKNNIISLSEPEKKLTFLIFLYLFAFKISCSAEHKFFFITLGPGLGFCTVCSGLSVQILYLFSYKTVFSLFRMTTITTYPNVLKYWDT